MEKIKIKGYITLSEKKYTFLYEKDRLSVLSCDEEYTILDYLKNITILEGITTFHSRVLFMINKEVRYSNGYFETYPDYVIFINNNVKEVPIEIDAIKFEGGDITRFYTNKRIIENDIMDIPTTELKLKDPKETVSTEICNINGKEVKLEFSVSKPGFIYDGKIKFEDINSNLRIKYKSKVDYLMAIKDVDMIERLFKLACVSSKYTFGKIDIEIMNEDKKYERIGNIYIPRMNQTSSIQNIFSYDFFEGKFNNLFNEIDKFEYIYEIISERRKNKSNITEKDYVSAFSCFQILYNWFNSNVKKEVNEIEKDLNEIKKEIIEELKKLDEKYKGVDSKKRKFINRFEELVGKSNVKLESNIIKVINDHMYIFERMHELYFENKSKELLENIEDYVIDAVKDRDDITHNGIVEINEYSLIIYRSVVISCYIMIFEKLGINKEKIKDNIQRMIAHNAL